MSAIDSADSPARQVATADALHLLPSNLRTRKSLELRGRVEALIPLLDQTRKAAAELQYARLMDQSSDRQQRHLDDLAARLSIACRHVADDPMARSLADLSDGINRLHWAQQAQTKIGIALINLAEAQRRDDENLYHQNQLVREACAKLSALSRIQRARQALAQIVRQVPASVPIYGAFFSSRLKPVVLRQGNEPAWPAGTDALGDHSNIAGAVHQFLSRMGSRRLRAILLLTDGRQVGGSLGPPLTESATPVFPILSAGRTRDLAIRRVISPKMVYADQPAEIESRIYGIGLPNAEVTCQLHAGNVTQTQSVQLNRAGTAIARWSVPLDRPGDQAVQLSIRPVVGEAITRNNTLGWHVHVLPTRLHVALIGTVPCRDFQFLRYNLEHTPWIDSTISLPGRSITTEQLSQQQVLILDDLAADQLNTAQWTLIRQLVEKKQTGLVLIAGGNHLPSEYSMDPLLSILLPFDSSSQPVWRTWAGQNAFFRFSPTDASIPMLDLQHDGLNESRQWAELPAMYHYLQMPPLLPSAQTLLQERESASPVLTVSRLGAGRIYFVGFNETWRWRRVSPILQTNFWLQLVRAAAPLSDIAQKYSLPAELANVSPETSLLHRLANSTTGELLSLSDIPEVWEKIQQHQRSHPATVENPLWHSPWLFALVLGCLGAEWGLRKRFGLA